VRRRGLIGLAAGVLALTLVAFTVACGSGGDDDTAGVEQATKLDVVATTVQITALTREVGGNLIDLHGIIPAGADPHSFEPTASDLTAIEDADVVLRHGIELDVWLDGTLSAAKHATVTVVTDGIELRKGEEDGKVVDDPHVWHDPDNAKIMVQNIAKALEQADPSNRDTYESNSLAYQAKLDDTKQQVQAIIDEIPAASRKLVTDHDAFGYFAHAFGLEIVGAVFPVLSTEAEPSASDTAKLLDTIKAEHVKAIFAESSVNPRLARALASDAGVTIVDDLYGDSLGEPGSGADTLDGMLLFNARKIAEALK
jgi:zinc/manganese transport system substrate-binding protein